MKKETINLRVGNLYRKKHKGDHSKILITSLSVESGGRDEYKILSPKHNYDPDKGKDTTMYKLEDIMKKEDCWVLEGNIGMDNYGIF